MPSPDTYVTAPDGVRLATRSYGDPAAPTLVCVHGFPDDRTVWDGVVEALAGDFHVVTYDVRGAGRSDRPRARRAYRLDRLADDLAAVVDAASPDRPVHLLGHDWGSLQVWYTLSHQAHQGGGGTLAGRVASFTSISGPDLDHAGAWLRGQLRGGVRGWGRFARQALSSTYIGVFLLPGPVDIATRLGIVGWVVRTDPSRRRTPVSRADVRDGLRLYRANMLRRAGRPPTVPIDVPVQVIAPRRDRYLGVAMQTDIGEWVADLRVHIADGGHWLPIEAPGYVAERVREIAGVA
jgi:pimeloyl-ACP methyl ester carboxylesterase